MSEKNRTPTRQFVEIVEAQHDSAESASDLEDNLQSQLLERRISSTELDRRITAIVAPLAIQLETLIQSVGELSERSFNRSTEGNVASERLGSSGQRSDRHKLHFKLMCEERAAVNIL